MRRHDSRDPIDTLLTTLSVHSLGFLHVGRLLTKEDATSEVARSLQRDSNAVHLVLPRNLADLDSEQVDPNDVIVVGDIANCVSPGAGGISLGRLREDITVHLQAERRILLVSSIPALRLLNEPGSPLVIDAKPLFLEAASPTASFEQIEASSSADLSRIRKVADGFPRLVKHLLPPLALPTRSERTFALLSEIELACSELGPEACERLQYFVSQEENFHLDRSELSPLEIAALRGAGFANSDDDWLTVDLLPFGNFLRSLVVEGINFYAESSTDRPNAYDSVVRDLWFVERRLRRFIGGNLRRIHGDGWRSRTGIAAGVGSSILERAQAQAFPLVDTMSRLPSPLEWLTLGELIDLMVSSEVEGQGLSIRQLGLLRRELLPIRDRIAHMRLVSEGDRRTVVRWKRLIESLPDP